MQKASFGKFTFITLLGMLVTALFGFLGAPILRVQRNVFGSFRYWTAGLVLFVLMWVFVQPLLALMLWSTWLVVGIYSEFEERGSANLWTAGLSVLVSSLILMGGASVWFAQAGVQFSDIFSQGLNQVLNQMGVSSIANEALKIDPKKLMEQIPSAVILLMMSSLAFALMLDRRMAALMGLNFEKIAGEMRLLDFRLPDFMVWIAMFSFLLSFLKLPVGLVNIVGSNVFNITMGLYFFQGLAVLEVLFLVFRVGNFTKFLVYFFIVGQLFFVLSAVGIIDYWVDFRTRLRRRKWSEGNQNNGEHI